MKRHILLAFILSLVLLATAASATGNYSAWYSSYSADAQTQAKSIDLSDLGFSLTDEQEEIFRLGVAHGYDLAKGSSSVSSTMSNASSSSDPLVWIPTRGGTKYHKKESCSNMKSPLQASLSVAKQKGYTPCSKCKPPQ